MYSGKGVFAKSFYREGLVPRFNKRCKMEEFFYPSADGQSRIHAVFWRPPGEALGVLQIIHGMSEYAERYSPFAEFMNSAGIAVCAEDHLGHGKTAANPGRLGFFDAAHDYKTVLSEKR